MIETTLTYLCTISMLGLGRIDSECLGNRHCRLVSIVSFLRSGNSYYSVRENRESTGSKRHNSFRSKSICYLQTRGSLSRSNRADSEHFCLFLRPDKFLHALRGGSCHRNRSGRSAVRDRDSCFKSTAILRSEINWESIVSYLSQQTAGRRLGGTISRSTGISTHRIYQPLRILRCTDAESGRVGGGNSYIAVRQK